MFKDRGEAGRLLASRLEKIVKGKDHVVVPLLRGGIVLGKIIADHFDLPLKPIAVKKLGAPLNPELGIGAVGPDKTSYFNKELLEELNVSSSYKKTVLEKRFEDARDLQSEVDKHTQKINLKNKIVIVVDDGIATGNTAICAALYSKKQKAKKIILATPVISKETLSTVKTYFDQIVVLKKVNNLTAVGAFYESFPQLETEEVIRLISN